MTLSELMEWLGGIYQQLSARAIAAYLDMEPAGLSLADCDVLLNSATWMQHGFDIRAAPPTATRADIQPVARLLKYLSSHRTLETAYRVRGENIFLLRLR